ncbi:MAG: ATP-binding cassette domain-containing protein, partial [Bacteroidales bacterium]|nr:ATP-binding cassette domain-containing protein [Bacteroidales bacterium]
EVELFGKTGCKNLLAERRKIGQIIETPAIYPDMTAMQNLEIQRVISGRPYKGAVKRYLAKVNLADMGRKKVNNFSLGMKQRLSLAMALISKPEFLILDEPVNGLDPKGIVETREFLRHLAQDKGITVMLSSHLLDELSQIATHYGIIHQGKLIKQISAEELVRESRRYILIHTDETEKVIDLLKEEFKIADWEQRSGNEIRIYEQTDKTGAINLYLAQHGIGLDTICTVEQKLEEYFINLITKGIQL